MRIKFVRQDCHEAAVKSPDERSVELLLTFTRRVDILAVGVH